MFFQKIYGLQPNTAFWSNTKGRLVDFQTKRVGVPFEGCSRLVRSAQCQIQRPFGRLKLGYPSWALEWMFLFSFCVCKWFARLLSNLCERAGRGLCLCLDGVELVGEQAVPLLLKKNRLFLSGVHIRFRLSALLKQRYACLYPLWIPSILHPMADEDSIFLRCIKSA